MGALAFFSFLSCPFSLHRFACGGCGSLILKSENNLYSIQCGSRKYFEIKGVHQAVRLAVAEDRDGNNALSPSLLHVTASNLEKGCH